MSNYSVTVYVNSTLESLPGHAFIGLTNPAGETIYRGLYPNDRTQLGGGVSWPSDRTPSGINVDAVRGVTGGAVIVDQFVQDGNNLQYTHSITQNVTEAQGQAVMDAITRAENNPNDAYNLLGSGGDSLQCTNFVRQVLNEAGVAINGVNTVDGSALPDSLIDGIVINPDGSIEPNTTNGTTDFRDEWTRRDEASTDQQGGGGMNVSGVSNPEILDFDTWRSENRVQVASNDDDLTMEDVHAIQQSRYEAYLAENGIDPSGKTAQPMDAVTATGQHPMMVQEPSRTMKSYRPPAPTIF